MPELKPITAMSNPEMNRELAERLGWKTEKHPDHDWYSMCFPETWRWPTHPVWVLKRDVWNAVPNFCENIEDALWAHREYINKCNQVRSTLHVLSERAWYRWLVPDRSVDDLRYLHDVAVVWLLRCDDLALRLSRAVLAGLRVLDEEGK